MINLTPHAITIRGTTSDVTIPPSGTVARVATIETEVGTVEVDGTTVPVVRRTFGEVQGLPDEGVPCIVSALVAAAVPDRSGVYAPDTGPTAIRDGEGRILAVTRLVAA